MHDVYKFKATTMIDEKDRHISDLEDKVRTLEKRLEGTTLTGDEHIQALVEERKQLEKKLDESRQHLSEVKTSWSDKINNLEAQSALETSQTEFVEREIEAEKQVTALENTGRCLKCFIMAGIKPPKPFSFQNAVGWPSWMDGFDDYRFTSRIHEKTD
ncbi:hypothetical protein MRX96_023059 [Rhipicephalus microplus]